MIEVLNIFQNTKIEKIFGLKKNELIVYEELCVCYLRIRQTKNKKGVILNTFFIV